MATELEYQSTSNSRDSELAERRRKMRDLKRRSRERKRIVMQDLQQQLRALEAQYQQLYSASMASAASASCFQFYDAGTSQLVLLHPHHQRYAAVMDEAQRLRLELASLRRRMELFDRCVSNIDGFLIGLARRRQPEPVATLLPASPPLQLDRVYLTNAASRELVRQCYLEICERKWPAGKCLSSGSQLLGWRDERFVDDASHELHFALSKRFVFGSLDAFVARTWEIVTSEKKHHARAVQRSTLGAKVLQVIDADTVLLQRRVYHAHLSTIACVNMLAFRVWTARGRCVVGFKSVKLPVSEDLSGVFEYDAEQRSWFHDDPGLKHVWVDTFQWWVLEEDDRAVESLLHDGEDEGTQPGRPAGLSVTMGGVTKNPDPKYIGYFLVEVLSCIMRWENAVAASQLSFLLGALDRDIEAGTGRGDPLSS